MQLICCSCADIHETDSNKRGGTEQLPIAQIDDVAICLDCLVKIARKCKTGADLEKKLIEL